MRVRKTERAGRVARSAAREEQAGESSSMPRMDANPPRIATAAFVCQAASVVNRPIVRAETFAARLAMHAFLEHALPPGISVSHQPIAQTDIIVSPPLVLPLPPMREAPTPPRRKMAVLSAPKIRPPQVDASPLPSSAMTKANPRVVSNPANTNRNQERFVRW